ncbi:hypothetical protein E2562_033335 [Oryza meyeriana var. granulata]|uniref:Uncharacterized protein n=1 Tax=Oryza meyeriana var. granulata TaxID=110450 RepID=A0A6G1E4Q2_9ORYZ|nr:hypothetical protein E2562_033335 [Oryza meyeriana var. granulata]
MATERRRGGKDDSDGHNVARIKGCRCQPCGMGRWSLLEYLRKRRSGGTCNDTGGGAQATVQAAR